MKAHHEAQKIVRTERYGAIMEATAEDDLAWWNAINAMNPEVDGISLENLNRLDEIIEYVKNEIIHGQMGGT